MGAYKEQPEFEYMNYTAQPPSVWERISWWISSIFQELFLNPNTPWITRFFYYLTVIVILGAAIFYIVRLRYGQGIAPDYQSYKSSAGAMVLEKPQDYNKLIGEALGAQNFKLAIRYLYLRALSDLNARQLIQLKSWKSPMDYQRELKGDAAGTYQELARLFEYVWYGDFDADKTEFEAGNQLASKLERAK